MANAANAVTANAVSALSPEVEWCDRYRELGLSFAHWFLLLALLLAIVEGVAVAWAKIQAARQAPAAPRAGGPEAVSAADAASFLDALKGLLEALKGLPAWFAVFLAGAALYWLSSVQPDACSASPPAQRPSNATGNDQQGNDAAPVNATEPANKGIGDTE